MFEAMQLAKLALEKRIKKTVHQFRTGNSAECPYCASERFLYSKDGRRNRYCGECGQMLTRADLASVRKQIDYWNNKVMQAEAVEENHGRNRAYHFVYRDL